jgi:hypothetical protein
MTRDELFEEIRVLLGEPQANLVDNPWEYSDLDLVPHIRSAIRHCRMKGVRMLAVISTDGDLTSAPTEGEGVLIALRVAGSLLKGDLLQKLLDGELGIYFRAGPDIVDTRDGAADFRRAADRYEGEFERALGIMLAQTQGGNDSVFTSQRT